MFGFVGGSEIGEGDEEAAAERSFSIPSREGMRQVEERDLLYLTWDPPLLTSSSVYNVACNISTATCCGTQSYGLVEQYTLLLLL
jgi:hypothetical protein